MKPILNRRNFVGLTAGAVAGTLVQSTIAASPAAKTSLRAIAFDAFPIFDPRPVFALGEELFPGKGGQLSNAWRARQFEYTWLRTIAGRYTDFWQVTEDALIFAARNLKLHLDRPRRGRLMNAYLNLKPWPDVPHTLNALKEAGIRLGLLSNFTQPMLAANVKNSGLDGVFEQILSTDRVQQFKPAPRAYQMAANAFGLTQSDITFAAFAGWDASGAKWFGFPTVWVNRLNAPAEELSVIPDLTCQDMKGLTAFMLSRR